MSEEITVLGFYETVREEIVKPNKTTFEAAYFLMKWEPTLGARASRIVRVLRSLGYYNHETKIERGGIAINLPRLAELCGFSVPTIKREFTNNPHLHKFVQREKNYKTHAVSGQIWREETIYRVRMTDPVHPDDEQLQREMVAAREKNSRRDQNDTYGEKRKPARKAQNESPSYQSESAGTQNEPSAGHSESEAGQDDLTLKTLTLTPLEESKESLSYAASAAPEFSLALLEQEPEQTEAYQAAYRQARKRLARPEFKAQHGRISEAADWHEEARAMLAAGGTASAGESEGKG